MVSSTRKGYMKDLSVIGLGHAINYAVLVGAFCIIPAFVLHADTDFLLKPEISWAS